MNTVYRWAVDGILAKHCCCSLAEGGEGPARAVQERRHPRGTMGG